MNNMKSIILTFAVVFISIHSFGQEKTSERISQIEPNVSIQADTVRSEIKTERTLKMKKETKKVEKESPVKNERAIRNEE